MRHLVLLCERLEVKIRYNQSPRSLRNFGFLQKRNISRVLLHISARWGKEWGGKMAALHCSAHLRSGTETKHWPWWSLLRFSLCILYIPFIYVIVVSRLSLKVLLHDALPSSCCPFPLIPRLYQTHRFVVICHWETQKLVRNLTCQFTFQDSWWFPF